MTYQIPTHYTAVLPNGNEAPHLVEFPDFPELNFQGQSLAEVMDHSRHLVKARVKDLLEQGEEVPRPLQCDGILTAAGMGSLIFKVPIETEVHRATPVSISVSKELLMRIDKHRGQSRLSRSAWFTLAAITMLSC